MDMMDDKFVRFREEFLTLAKSFFSAPDLVQGQPPLSERPTRPDSDLQDGTYKPGVRKEGPVLDRNLDSPPPLSAEAANELKSLEAMFRSGTLSREGFMEARGRLYARVARNQLDGDSDVEGSVPPPGGNMPGPSGTQ